MGASRPPLPSRWTWLLYALSALGTLGAWLWFASHPAMQVLVGTRPIDAQVPTLYQVSVFPCFFVYCGWLALDLVQGKARSGRAERLALLLITGLLSVLRLAGGLALSGHGLFLSAALAYWLRAPAHPAKRALVGLALGGLAFTAYFKLLVWHDAFWFALSLAAGSVLGLVGSALTRRQMLSLAERP